MLLKGHSCDEDADDELAGTACRQAADSGRAATGRAEAAIIPPMSAGSS